MGRCSPIPWIRTTAVFGFALGADAAGDGVGAGVALAVEAAVVVLGLRAMRTLTPRAGADIGPHNHKYGYLRIAILSNCGLRQWRRSRSVRRSGGSRPIARFASEAA